MVVISQEDFEDIFEFANEYAEEYLDFENECKIREIYHAIKAERLTTGQDVIKIYIKG